jgi:hypothetical protein
MSSTVTTATVSAVTTATLSDGLGHVLPLIMLLALAVGLFAREMLVGSSGHGARRLGRGLDIGNAPLLISFAVIVVINTAHIFGAP